ncbi:uncharacterized protein LOC117323990 [Pecten maximus]|uniref:uncharacterized protein LOC117323990 n=1 Tax=Pecten maximus TaxID=6579 RepID=UPI00145826DF|nr:uncharacterized protein LOC117323990 [Pecten maximus]
MPKTKLYVGGLVDDVGNDRLHRTFEKFGKIKKVWVARNPGSRGYAFIDFYDPEHALNASEEMNGKHIFGSNIKVELSTNGIECQNSEKHRGDRNYEDRRGDRGYGDRRDDRERDRRRGDRDYRGRRSPPHYSRRRSIPEDDEDNRLTDLGHIHPSDLPKTLNILKELERVTRLRLERELLDKIRSSSAILPDINLKDSLHHSSRSFEEDNNIPSSSRNRDTEFADPYVASVDPIFQDRDIQTFDDERPVMIDSKPDRFYSQCPSNARGPPRCLLPTPNFPKLKNFQNHHSFHGNPHIPPWHVPRDVTRPPLRPRHHPYSNLREHNVNSDHNNDWYGKKYYGFGFLPISAKSSANKKEPSPHMKLPPPQVPPVNEPEFSEIADTSLTGSVQ